MVSLKGCFPRKSGHREPPYDDDVIYPVYKLDNTKTFRSLILAWTLCFNDVLDAEKLRASLAKLLEIGDWRKLGGRLKLKVEGILIQPFNAADCFIRLMERWRSMRHVHLPPIGRPFPTVTNGLTQPWKNTRGRKAFLGPTAIYHSGQAPTVSNTLWLRKMRL